MKKWMVERPGRVTEDVLADSYKIKEGVLEFYNHLTDGEGLGFEYHRIVIAYAPGAWLTMVEVDQDVTD